MADDDQFGSGVGSVFAAIASEREAEPAKPAAVPPGRSRKNTALQGRTTPSNDQQPAVQPVARTGRYPGKKNGPPKQKITARIPSELRNAYVNWSFEERCPVSELIERALTEFYQRRRAATEKGK